jgi:hypothetical protein
MPRELTNEQKKRQSELMYKPMKDFPPALLQLVQSVGKKQGFSGGLISDCIEMWLLEQEESKPPEMK